MTKQSEKSAEGNSFDTQEPPPATGHKIVFPVSLSKQYTLLTSIASLILSPALAAERESTRAVLRPQTKDINTSLHPKSQRIQRRLLSRIGYLPISREYRVVTSIISA